jgi:8-oxo-dGTP pyrophosphatase MutT (NUDIX family)
LKALAADAVVTAGTNDQGRCILLVERGDGHGWALPGGMVEPGETPPQAAIRELAEETGLAPGRLRRVGDPVPAVRAGPRASDEAWIVTVASRTHLGQYVNWQAGRVMPPAINVVGGIWVVRHGPLQGPVTGHNQNCDNHIDHHNPANVDINA